MDPRSLFDDECDVSGASGDDDDEPIEEETEEDARFIDDAAAGESASEGELAAARRLLGVQQDASAEEVAQEFRSRAKTVHPDKDPTDGADRRFTDLIHARDLLQSQSSKKRRRVDPEEPRAHVPFADQGLTIWYAEVTLESLRNRQRVRVRGTVSRDASGRVFEEGVYNVVIEPGARDGTELCRLLGKGDYSAEDESRQPLVVRLRVAPAGDKVERRGCNLESPLVMRLEDAMTPGKAVSIDMLGAKAVVTVPRNGYWTGDKITLKEQGLPEPGSDSLCGDLILTVTVEKPTRGEVREFARKILNVEG